MRSDGRMSIHETAAGIRCPGGTHVEAQAARRVPQREHQLEPKKARRNDPDTNDSELQAAFEVANQKRLRRFVSEPDTKPIDRRIYGVSGAQIVRGGQPGHGKRS
jgi:hypothetical protein